MVPVSHSASRPGPPFPNVMTPAQGRAKSFPVRNLMLTVLPPGGVVPESSAGKLSGSPPAPMIGRVEPPGALHGEVSLPTSPDWPGVLLSR